MLPVWSGGHVREAISSWIEMNHCTRHRYRRRRRLPFAASSLLPDTCPCIVSNTLLLPSFSKRALTVHYNPRVLSSLYRAFSLVGVAHFHRLDYYFASSVSPALSPSQVSVSFPCTRHWSDSVRTNYRMNADRVSA